MSWEEMNPDLLQMVEGDKAGGAIMKAILYILIGFGIFGTVMMMVVEMHLARRGEMAPWVCSA
ncbi:MAG: hypothetical protein U5K79_13245 [Cyclobacteriaceae bacterium]|nr:hypothetical protein [Cyclobacteriaceae bacterium]